MMPFIEFNGISVPTFFLVISISLSFLVVYLSYRVDYLNLDRKLIFDFAILLMISGFIGGRLMHVLYEEWPYYLKRPWQIIYFWQGGFVFYGGLLFSILITWFYSRIRKVNFLSMADFFAPTLSLAHALGRMGCYFAGCCYGAKCQLPELNQFFSNWKILGTLDGRHPTVLYLIIGEILIFNYLIFLEKKFLEKKLIYFAGALFVKWILVHSLMRLFVEYFRDDFRGAFYTFPLFGRISVSQIISLGLIFFSILFLSYHLFLIKKKKLTST